LVRLKALASQAGSSQLSNTERGMLDTEYQAMKSEIDRLSANTTFNNQQLMNANVTVNNQGGYWSNAIDIAVGGIPTSTAAAQINLNYTSVGGNYIVTAQAQGNTFAGTFNANLLSSSGTLVSGSAIRLIAVTGAVSALTQKSGDNSYITLSFSSGVNVTSSLAGGTDSSVLTGTGNTTTTFAFKVGTSGIATNDQISLAIRGVNKTALGLANSDVTTQIKADAAAAAVTEAINVIVASRSEVGAVQNRLDSAQTNISTIMENIEAARSSYLDLDVAAEMATFTSKQILVQAGVSMLSQAKQAPEALLKLFQQ